MKVALKNLLANGLATIATATCIVTASAAGTLPGGATSLTETHGDWQLNCVDEAANISCAITQTQVDPESRKQIIAVEMRSDGEYGLSGALVLPFGLALSKGIAVGIDDQEASLVLGFTTCLPIGCIVPLGFDADSIEALAEASTLNITGTANDTGGLVALQISLQGLTAAFVRMQEILSEGT